MKSVPTGDYKKTPSKEFSDFACSDVFRVFSDMGAAEIRRIAFKLKVSEISFSFSNFFLRFLEIPGSRSAK